MRDLPSFLSGAERQARLLQREPGPAIKADEVLVRVRAAGVNRGTCT